MVKYERLELANAIEKFLSIKQKENAKSIRKAVRRKKRKDLSLGERIASIFDLHFHKSKAIDIADLVKSFKEFNTANNLYVFPDELKTDMEYIGSRIMSSDFNELTASINYALVQANDAVRKDLDRKNEKLLKSLKKSKLEAKNIVYFEEGRPINASLEAGLIHLGNQKLMKLNSAEQSRIVHFNTSWAEGEEVPLSEAEQYLVETEDMLRRGEIQESDITKNIKEIREALRRRTKLDDLSVKIWKIMNTLQREGRDNGIDFSKAYKILKTIYERCRRQITSCDDYLSKFDFATLQEKITWVREKREQEAWVQSHLEAVNQVEEITPRNPQVVEQIKQSNKITMEAKKALRHIAFHELQLSGHFSHSSHLYVGDAKEGVLIYSPIEDEEQEKLIRQKIDEMITISTQTPEERAISYLNSKSAGKMTLEDLASSELSEYSASFGDDSYSFDVAGVREIKSVIDAQRMKKATAICREYMKYRAAVKGTDTVTFSEYARTVYLQENMDLSMVDKNIRDMDLALVAEEQKARKVI